jgi:hypothetical protein
MHAESFDPVEFFRAIHCSGARALLIGGQAMRALGLDMETKDYDFWLHRDDVALLNAALEPLDLIPDRAPEEIKGFYRLEGDEIVDVWVARSIPTVDGSRVSFDDLWSRRQQVEVSGAIVNLPTIEDLILTKRFGNRPKDAQDIHLLQALLRVQAERKEKP